GVPRAFCVTSDAYDEYLAANGLVERHAWLERALPDGAARVALRSLATEHPWPSALARGVAAARDAFGEARRFVVRSSAVDEDGAGSSLAVRRGRQTGRRRAAGPSPARRGRTTAAAPRAARPPR